MVLGRGHCLGDVERQVEAARAAHRFLAQVHPAQRGRQLLGDGLQQQLVVGGEPVGQPVAQLEQRLRTVPSSTTGTWSSDSKCAPSAGTAGSTLACPCRSVCPVAITRPVMPLVDRPALLLPDVATPVVDDQPCSASPTSCRQRTGRHRLVGGVGVTGWWRRSEARRRPSPRRPPALATSVVSASRAARWSDSRRVSSPRSATAVCSPTVAISAASDASKLSGARSETEIAATHWPSIMIGVTIRDSC